MFIKQCKFKNITCYLLRDYNLLLFLLISSFIETNAKILKNLVVNQGKV